MPSQPSLLELKAKVKELIEDTIETNEPLAYQRPLGRDYGLDSLDFIEVGFTLQEFFGFEFSDLNALEELERVVGGGQIILEGHLTELGKEQMLERMPELKTIALPEALNPVELQTYYTIETFARLMHEFYLAAPDVCPETGEPVVVEAFQVVSAHSKRPVPLPTGDELVLAWVSHQASALAAVP